MLKRNPTTAVRPARLLAFSAIGWLASIAAPSAADVMTSSTMLGVDATITTSCLLSSAMVTFGSYDPLVAHASSPLDGMGSITVVCTKGSAVTVMLSQGINPAPSSTDSAPVRRMSDGASHHLQYAIFSDASRATPWGNTTDTGVVHSGSGVAQQLTIYGRIPGGQSGTAGSYTDSVLATVSF